MSQITIGIDFTESHTYNSSGAREKYEHTYDVELIPQFSSLYYDAQAQTLNPNRWFGVPLIKYPTDLFIYQELLSELQPDVILETGTAYGGSALFFAHLCDLIGKGEVITIDKATPKPDTRKAHPRIQYLLGDSVNVGTVAHVTERIAGRSTFVILDSLHTRDHVLRELEVYAPLATTHLVVEDTNVNGHPVRPDFGPGPLEAVQEFLASHPEWYQDRSYERLLLTCAPGGFLRRK